jgi:tetratricopeptide (TPR) repeat protein
VSLKSRRVTLLLLAIVALIVQCPPAAWAQQQQEIDTYLRLLDGYRAYDETVARALGNFWEKLELEGPSATDRLAKLVPIELGPISQMALTDLAFGAFLRDKKLVADTHLALAQRWIDFNLMKTVADRIQHERQLRFARDWYHAIIWLRFAHAEAGHAAQILRVAREKFPDDPEVFLSSGTFEAMQLTRMRVESGRPRKRAPLPFSNIRLPPNDQPASFQTTGSLAKQYLNKAIQLDPNAAEARIRLAYLLDSDGSQQFEEAARLLNEAHAIDPKPPLSYLAALFAGDVEERREQPDAAAGWYRKAIADCPRAQTARLALSHLQLRLKEGFPGAQNTLRPLVGGPPPEDGVCEPDPWRTYEFGQSWRLTELVVRMRRYVREPVEGSQP